VKLRFGGRIRNTKDLELHRGSRARKLKIQLNQALLKKKYSI
jgi:hypothetical protein